MRKTFFLAIAITMLSAGVAWPATYYLRPPDGSTNGSKDLQDMDHYSYYVWDFHGDYNDEVVYRATLTFTCIYNNTPTSSDALFVHLLDSGLHGIAPANYTGAYSGPDTVTMHEWVRSDSDTNASHPTPVASDRFLLADFSSKQTPLFTWYNVNDHDAGDVPKIIPVTSGTAATLTYEFTAAQLAALNGYISNDDLFALGFDPDCHYVNEGIKLTLYTQPIPEPGTMMLLGSGLVGLAGWGRKKFRK